MDNSPIQEQKKTVVTEPTLFDMESTEKQNTPIMSDKNVKSEETRDPMTYVRSLTKQTKKIKRIILFFEDGSFEDYEKE